MGTDSMLVSLSPRELLPYKDDFYLWKFVPSMPVAIIFLIIFLALSILHTWRMYRERMWFCLPFVIGGYLEVTGYGGRAAANKATDQLGPYVIQSVFLLIPPSLFAASIYMTLGRVIRNLGLKAESCLFIKVRWLTTIFVVGDIFAFLVQSGGAGFMAAGTDPKMGEIIVVSGLAIQILFFGVFVAAAVSFQMKYCHHSPKQQTASTWKSLFCRRQEESNGEVSWRSMMNMLYAVSVLILARSIFRIIEYVMGADAYLLSNEWPLYVFDGVLMAGAMAIFYVYYPSSIRSAQSLSQADTLEIGEMGNSGSSKP
ncbi:RTA1 like protein-domain-containing protein [Dactylonectria macrodidyma]|uniref:RTA1 like protein-domain-containing protein n=1 Tax=Dactylonectria macrodidyma TaxID=307937 RepID=A0A9P9ER88_9HYPO|nr:RTA1 like protein-domain-containing protein [Dactylonectria macrodidyma]